MCDFCHARPGERHRTACPSAGRVPGALIGRPVIDPETRLRAEYDALRARIFEAHGVRLSP